MKKLQKIFKENWMYLYLIGIIILIALFVLNTHHSVSILQFDNKIFEYFKSVTESRKTVLMKFFTFYGDFYIPVSIIILTAIIYKKKNYWKVLLGGYAFAGLVAFAAKLLVLRARPSILLISAPDPYSFPSGHTLTSTCFYLLFAYLMLRNTTLANKIIYYSLYLFLIILIGASRVYLGVHYCSDVIGGFIIGIICTLVIINIVKLNTKENV